MVRLGSVSSIVTGKTPSTSDESNFGGEIPFVTPADLDLEHDIGVTLRTLSDRGANLGKVGYAGRSVALNQQINAVVFDQSKVFPRFGFYACKRLKPIMENMAPATTVAIISKSKFAELEIPLPPLEEQKRIAAILDQADALRRLRARALDRLNALGQAIFHEMFGDFSEGESSWPLVRLGDLIESGKIGLVRGANEQGEDRPVKYLRMDAISQDGSLDLSSLRRVDASVRERQEFSLLPGDLLFNTRNSRELVGKTAVVRRPFDGVFNNNILRLRFSGALNSSFLDAYLRTQGGSSALDTIKSGTTSVFAIYQKTLLELQVPTPPPTLQLEFEERLNTLLDRIELSDVAMKKADTLFTSLQHRAFRGEL